MVYLVGHRLADVGSLHNHWHDIRYRDATFRVFIHSFSTPCATMESYLTSPVYTDLCNAPNPDLVLIFMGSNDIKEDTVVAELQASITGFCKQIEEVTQSFAKVFTIEPRSRYLGVNLYTYDHIRNSFNRNIQNHKGYYRRRCVVNPMRFEHMALDGVNPSHIGTLWLVQQIKTTIGSFLYSGPATVVRQ